MTDGVVMILKLRQKDATLESSTRYSDVLRYGELRAGNDRNRTI